MINRNNVVDYVNFLYRKRMYQDAPQDLLNSWNGLSDNEVAIHLNGLYRHWNLDAITSKNYEQEFLRINAREPIMPPAAAPAPNITAAPPPAQPYVYPAQKKNNTGLWVFAIAALLTLAGLGYYFLVLKNKDTGVSPEVSKTDKIDTPIAVKAPEAPKEIEPAAAPMDASDSENARIINSLMVAEETRNFDAIYSNFSTNMERYWDINYPTYDELRDRYQSTWDKTENIKHENVSVKKVSTNTYDVTSTFSYFSLKDQKRKSTKSKVRFVFDDNHKIIKSYGL